MTTRTEPSALLKHLGQPVLRDGERRPWPRQWPKPKPEMGVVARLRAWWNDNVLRHEGELCMACGRRYSGTIWHADDDLWSRVVQGRVKLVCPTCFGRWADEEGLMIVWKPQDWDRENSRPTEPGEMRS